MKVLAPHKTDGIADTDRLHFLRSYLDDRSYMRTNTSKIYANRNHATILYTIFQTCLPKLGWQSALRWSAFYWVMVGMTRALLLYPHIAFRNVVHKIKSPYRITWWMILGETGGMRAISCIDGYIHVTYLRGIFLGALKIVFYRQEKKVKKQKKNVRND